jgi:hypothetical protein
MPDSTHPEDSILKRHFDATVEMKRQMWLQIPPTDSILHRHAMSMSNLPTVRPSARVSRDTLPSSANPSAEDKKGLFSWLFSLFRSA